MSSGVSGREPGSMGVSCEPEVDATMSAILGNEPGELLGRCGRGVELGRDPERDESAARMRSAWTGSCRVWLA